MGQQKKERLERRDLITDRENKIGLWKGKRRSGEGCGAPVLVKRAGEEGEKGPA